MPPPIDPSPSWIPPSESYRRHYDRYNYDFEYNPFNDYLRSNRYWVSEPVFYDGYRWRPPVYDPILFGAGMTLLALDAIYNPTFYPSGYHGIRDSVSEMTGANRYAVEFSYAGVSNAYDLVAQGRTTEHRANLANATGIPYSEVRKAVGQADLMRVNGIGPHNSRLLVDAGINSMQDLARYSWDAQGLYAQLQYSAFYDGQRAPSMYEVRNWISQARNLPIAIYDDPGEMPGVPTVLPAPPIVYPMPPRRSTW